MQFLAIFHKIFLSENSIIFINLCKFFTKVYVLYTAGESQLTNTSVNLGHLSSMLLG